MVKKNIVSVAEFLSHYIDKSYKTQREIAIEIGYSNPNMITMLKQGLTKLPLDKIGVMAKALGIDPGVLFYFVMTEYMPETLDALAPIMQGLQLSKDERQLIHNYRTKEKLKKLL